MAKLNVKKLSMYFILFIEISDIHHHSTRISSENLYLPRNNYARTNKSITIFGVKFWNCVPSDIEKMASKIACYSKLLKKHLLSKQLL